MPAFYAHSRFGEKVRERLDGELKKILVNHAAAFEIGLQGPDIFFFYKPFKENKVNQYGTLLHSRPAYDFFERNAGQIGQIGKDSDTYSYLLGFLCHFVLDSACHGYVEEMVKERGISHLEMEEELDKMLLRKDGKNPFSYPLAGKIPTDLAMAAAMEPVFDSISRKEIRKALKDMKRIRRFLTTESVWKQAVINSVFHYFMKEKELKGMMNQLKDDPRCKETNQALYNRFQKAIPLAEELLKAYDETVDGGKTLHPYFNRNFE